MRMIKTPKFDLWLRIETGRTVVAENNLDNFTISDHEVKIEVRVGGRWTEIEATSLT